MKITVIICTYNRSASLGKTLESVAVSTMPDSVAWEILVVDNNSRDKTREVVEEFSRRYPGRFRYLFEPKQGKSNALNSGIREARSEILAFTDDDVTVEPSWLKNLCTVLEGSEWAGAAGRIYPPPDVTPPYWLAFDGPHSMGSILALFDRGPEPLELHEAPYGANVAFRKEMFEKYGGYRTDLGPTAGSEVRGEDTEFCLRIMKGGERVVYEPSAVVYHDIPDKRLQRKYFLTWWFAYGRAVVRTKERRTGPVWGIPRPYIGIINRLGRMLPAKALKWMRTSEPRSRFWLKCEVWMLAGEALEIFRRRSSESKTGAGEGEEKSSFPTVTG